MLRSLSTALVLIGLSLPLFSAEENLAKKTQGLDIRLISETKTVSPGKPFTVGLNIHHHSGYHTYWKHPGIVGMPTSLDWTLPEGFTASAIQWPYPKKTSMAGHPCHGYERDITLLITITPPQAIKNKNITLTAAAGWMCCAKNCFPGHKTFTLTLPVSNKILRHPENAKLIQQSRQEVPISSPGCKASLLSGATDSNIKILLSLPKDVTSEELYLFSFDGQISSELPQQFTKQSDGKFLLTIDRSEFSPKKNTHLPAVFKMGNLHLWINPAYAKK